VTGSSPFAVRLPKTRLSPNGNPGDGEWAGVSAIPWPDPRVPVLDACSRDIFRDAKAIIDLAILVVFVLIRACKIDVDTPTRPFSPEHADGLSLRECLLLHLPIIRRVVEGAIGGTIQDD
jgi:hypothetical protein